MNATKTPFFHGKRRVWLLVAILLVAAVLAVVIPLTLLHAYQQNPATGSTGPRSFAVGSDALLALKEQGGNISVFPSNTNTITVQPRAHGTIVAPNPQNVRILYSRTLTAQGHDQINVTTDPWFSDIDFYITIPASAVVQITISEGSIDVHTGHGLTASTSSGSIALDSIQGPTNVHTESGDVTANGITGPLTIEDQSGSISIQHIMGQVQARTSSGDVTASDSALSGQSMLQTQHGSVHLSGSIDPRGSYNLQTTSGDIEATLPADAAFSLEASTTSGTIQNAFGSTTVGAAPRAQLSIHTQSGSIIIAKAA